jgi:fructose-bisphosphate aldolase class I
MNTSEMTAKIAAGKGFIAALDQSGGSTPRALKGYGIEDDAWSNDEEMFGLIHDMRARIITSPAFTGEKVIGAILFERTMDGQVDGKPTPQALMDRGVVPFIKIDKGLEDEADGVQMMKPIPGLDKLLAKAKGLGVFGTKERSVINSANAKGIAAIVRQQVEVGQQVLASGLVPMLEPEINIKSPDRADSDQIMLNELITQLSAMPGTEKVMLKLSLPVKPGLFDPLVNHPRVLRVVALSGGYNRPDACAELAKNRGIVASFSRALLEDLRFQMSDDEFDASLASAIDDIYRGSTQKIATATA